ncbi:MAG: HPF/RaiA family ribosome-associated protein [Gemmatimonadales bacterium]
MITARHCNLAAELRARARDLAERLARLASRPHHAHVIFADDHGEAAVEIQLQVPRGRVHVGKALAADHRSALDQAAARVRRQLQRGKSGPRARRQTAAGRSGAR